MTGVARAAMYSGTFDPPTLAHVGIMSHVVRNSDIAKLLVVVNTRSSPKVYRCTAEQRRAMILAALPSDIADRIEVVVEPDRGKNAVFEERVAEGRFSWFGVIGEDSFALLPPNARDGRSWLVVTRDHSLDGKLPANARRIAIPDAGRNISSTRARALLESGHDTSELLPTGVITYIKAHALYVMPAMAALASRQTLFNGLWTMLAGAQAAMPPPQFVPTQAPEEMPNYIKRYIAGDVKG